MSTRQKYVLVLQRAKLWNGWKMWGFSEGLSVDPAWQKCVLLLESKTMEGVDKRD